MRVPISSTMAGVPRAALVGAAAGAAGTLAMDLLWYWRARRFGSAERFWSWESAAGTADYDQAGAPARTAQKLAGMAGAYLPDSSARTATNVMHWAMGTSWGAGYGAATLLTPKSARPAVAAAFPVTVFAFSYTALGLLGIYKPLWAYPPSVLVQDFTAHLVYGATTAVSYQVLER